MADTQARRDVIFAVRREEPPGRDEDTSFSKSCPELHLKGFLALGRQPRMVAEIHLQLSHRMRLCCVASIVIKTYPDKHPAARWNKAEIALATENPLLIRSRHNLVRRCVHIATNPSRNPVIRGRGQLKLIRKIVYEVITAGSVLLSQTCMSVV
jgi:hypothetical protein